MFITRVCRASFLLCSSLIVVFCSAIVIFNFSFSFFNTFFFDCLGYYININYHHVLLQEYNEDYKRIFIHSYKWIPDIYTYTNIFQDKLTAVVSSPISIFFGFLLLSFPFSFWNSLFFKNSCLSVIIYSITLHRYIFIQISYLI